MPQQCREADHETGGHGPRRRLLWPERIGGDWSAAAARAIDSSIRRRAPGGSGREVATSERPKVKVRLAPEMRLDDCRRLARAGLAVPGLEREISGGGPRRRTLGSGSILKMKPTLYVH